jgi:hypothetical protein
VPATLEFDDTLLRPWQEGTGVKFKTTDPDFEKWFVDNAGDIAKAQGSVYVHKDSFAKCWHDAIARFIYRGTVGTPAVMNKEDFPCP